LAVGPDNPDWNFQEAVTITFVHGLSPRAIAERLNLAAHELNLSSDSDALTHFAHSDGKAIFDAGNGWTVLYEDNGIPHDSTYRLANDPEVDEAVLVFRNVNSVMEFGYWHGGERLVGFEFPDERYGTRPDALLDDMRTTTGLSSEDYGREMEDNTYLPRMMTLASRITSVHLDRDFLRRRLLAVDPTD
jgi:hypothetical protein